jgi:hypothetical protein
MKNSLRKKFNNLMSKYNLKFIEIELDTAPEKIIDYICLGVYITDEYEKLKYEKNYVVVFYDTANNTLYRLLEPDIYTPAINFIFHLRNERIEDEIFISIMQQLLKINIKTHKLPNTVYYKRANAN